MPRFGSYKSKNGQAIIWVTLIEKAWAKLCGNYERIILGTLDMGFIHLCGVPSVSCKHILFKNKRDELFNAIKIA